MMRPLFKKASSRRRVESVSKLKVVSEKIEPSGVKRTYVPCFSVSPVISNF